VHLHGAVNDLGGNVGTFVNGMQTFIGGFSPSNSTLNASEWQALQQAGKQYGKIATELGQQVYYKITYLYQQNCFIESL
jgi:hypothetical protein